MTRKTYLQVIHTVKEVRKVEDFLREKFRKTTRKRKCYTVKNDFVVRSNTYASCQIALSAESPLLHPLLCFSLGNFPGKRFRMHPMMTITAKRDRFIQKTLQFLPAVFVNIPTFGNLVVGMKILVRAKHVTGRAGAKFSGGMIFRSYAPQ